jgi:V/A-type H+-transporting ATPase subunit B
MSDWDNKLLKYGVRFEEGMMDLSVNIPLEQALDRGWSILSDCFTKEETGLRTELLNKFWPSSRESA